MCRIFYFDTAFPSRTKSATVGEQSIDGDVKIAMDIGASLE